VPGNSAVASARHERARAQETERARHAEKRGEKRMMKKNKGMHLLNPKGMQ